MSTSAQHRVERRTARRVTSSAVNALLVVATLAGLAYLAPSLLGYQRYVITGGSMTGTIDKGSIVLEKAVPVADLAVGDVITYQPPADSGVPNLVTHRIIEIGTAEGGGRLLRTQGDANPQPDPWRFSLTAPTQPVVRHRHQQSGTTCPTSAGCSSPSPTATCACSSSACPPASSRSPAPWSSSGPSARVDAAATVGRGPSRCWHRRASRPPPPDLLRGARVTCA